MMMAAHSNAALALCFETTSFGLLQVRNATAAAPSSTRGTAAQPSSCRLTHIQHVESTCARCFHVDRLPLAHVLLNTKTRSLIALQSLTTCLLAPTSQSTSQAPHANDLLRGCSQRSGRRTDELVMSEEELCTINRVDDHDKLLRCNFPGRCSTVGARRSSTPRL